jgi:hypothetical protein
VSICRPGLLRHREMLYMGDGMMDPLFDFWRTAALVTGGSPGPGCRMVVRMGGER